MGSLLSEHIPEIVSAEVGLPFYTGRLDFEEGLPRYLVVQSWRTGTGTELETEMHLGKRLLEVDLP